MNRKIVMVIMLLAGSSFPQVNLDTLCLSDIKDQFFDFIEAQDTSLEFDTSVYELFDLSGTCDSLTVSLKLGAFPIPFYHFTKHDQCNLRMRSAFGQFAEYLPDSVNASELPADTLIDFCQLAPVRYPRRAGINSANAVLSISSPERGRARIDAGVSSLDGNPGLTVFSLQGRLVYHARDLHLESTHFVTPGHSGSFVAVLSRGGRILSAKGFSVE